MTALQRQTSGSISAIIPVYNGELFLANAIRNILGQDYEPLEIIVVDDGSTDNTARIAAQFGAAVKYIHQAHRGPAAARNKGIRQAQGEIIAFLDVDDEWTEKRLARQAAFFAKHPDVDIVQGLIVQMQLDESAPGEQQVFEESSEPYQFVNVGSALFRRSVFDKVGLFDESMFENEDTDWFFRAWEQNIVKVVQDQVALRYRRHQANMTSEPTHPNLKIVKVFKKHLDRERARGEQSSGAASRSSVVTYIGLAPTKKQTASIQNENFTIISNDCWGSGPYNHLNMMYRTPFIGTRVFGPCFMELLRNPRAYIAAPLQFIEKSRYRFMNELRAGSFGFYPLALLKGKVEIHFIHETDRVMAQQKWERRARKINWDNIYVKFSQDRDLASGDTLTEFDKLKYPYKVCFTYNEWPDLRSTIAMPDYFAPEAPMYFLSRRYFDTIAWLDKRYGPDSQAYRVANPAATL